MTTSVRILLPLTMLATLTAFGAPLSAVAQQKCLMIAHAGLGAGEETLDPTFSSLERSVHLNLFDSLVRSQREGSRVVFTTNGIAESWRVLPGGTHWEFKIRPGVKFHDGSVMTAADVAFTINHIVDPKGKTELAQEFTGILSAEARDAQTVIVTTDKNNVDTIASLSRAYIVPKKYFESAGAKGFADKPIGSGPFKLVSWVPGDETKLEAFAGYWGGAPRVPCAVFKTVKENATRVAMLKSGQADLVNNLPPGLYHELTKDAELTTFIFRDPQHVMIGLDSRSGPFKDVRVRQAVNHAVNRQEIYEKLFQAFARPGSGLIADSLPGYEPSVEQIFPYDPEKAKKLLAEAGYPNGFSTEIIYTPGRYLLGDQTIQAVAGYLGAVGIKVTATPADGGARMKSIREGKVPGMFQTSCLNQKLDPGACLGLWVYKEAGRGWYWPDFNIDARYAEQSHELNAETRVKELARLNKVIVEKAPFLWLLHENTGWAMRKGITLAPNPFGYIDLRNLKQG
jgi:peptide/nickel transport system substrate-binding protein